MRNTTPTPKNSAARVSRLPPPGDQKRRLAAIARAIADGSYAVDRRLVARRMLASGALQ